MFEDSRYSHTLTLDISDIKNVDKKTPMTNGVMSLGPELSDNQLYHQIKEQSKDYFKEDIVSFYTTPGNKDIRMQLGGFEE